MEDQYDIGYKEGYFYALQTKEFELDHSTNIKKELSYQEGYKQGFTDAKNNQPKNNISLNYPPIEWSDEIEPL